jgi:hypothetical protein
MRRTVYLLGCLLSFNPTSLLAANGYEVTSTDGKTTKTYTVHFGGTKASEVVTAFDPASQTFVYLYWKRDTPMPKPAGSIWVAATGETIPLYKFPDVETPLPIIESIKALKVCPYTGDKMLKVELKKIID